MGQSEGSAGRRGVRLWLCATALACALAAAACGSSGSGSGGGDGSASKNTITIGWSQRGLAGSDWWKTLIAGGQYEAKKLGAKIEVLDANRDTTQQNQDVQTLITRGVDVVVMNANDPIGVAPAVHALKKAGIPLVEVNSNLDGSLVPDTFCYVAEDQVATGEKAGTQIAKEAIARYGKNASVKLVAIGGYPGDVITELRFKGFMQGYQSVMQRYPNFKTTTLPIRYGHWLPDQALSPIRDVATANPDLKIVFSESDVMQAGIEQALKQAGLWSKGILEGSYDGGMNGIKEMVSDPKGPFQADASNQPWDQGVAAVKMAVAAVHKDTSACPTRTNFVETTLVTPKTAQSYYKPSQTYVRANGEAKLTHG
jgi:ribose transport system substrate-binding protein